MPDTPTTPSADLVIKCVGLTKVFKDFWLRNRVVAVDHVDIDVRRGEVFGLLGPNGSGKSTAIKMILGLLHPTDGRIAVFGHHPRDVAIKEKIGYLPEESYLYRFLNARETLEYYARLFHQNRQQRRRRIDQLLQWVGLEHVARRPVGEYSKGMQRRIGLAQALINDPQLLILDEPTSGLDPIGTRQIKDLILELARRGKTVLLCSHLLGDVEDVCDRVAIMYGGKLRKSGAVDDLLVQQDRTIIQTALLSAEEIQEVESALEKRGQCIERVDRPRQRLEQLFLDIVHEAQSEGAALSGARSDGKMADFLTATDAHMPEDTQPSQLIDQLTQTPEVIPPPLKPQASSPKPPSIETNLEALDELITEMDVAGMTPKQSDAPTTIERELASQPAEEIVRSDEVELPDWAHTPRSETENGTETPTPAPGNKPGKKPGNKGTAGDKKTSGDVNSGGASGGGGQSVLDSLMGDDTNPSDSR